MLWHVHTAVSVQKEYQKRAGSRGVLVTVPAPLGTYL